MLNLIILRILKNIFGCVFSVHKIIGLSRHEQVCLMRPHCSMPYHPTHINFKQCLIFVQFIISANLSLNGISFRYLKPCLKNQLKKETIIRTNSSIAIIGVIYKL